MQLLYEHTQHLELSMDKIGDEQENSSRFYKIFDKYELFRMINQLENFEILQFLFASSSRAQQKKEDRDEPPPQLQLNDGHRRPPYASIWRLVA